MTAKQRDWIKRRARSIMRYYGAGRHEAVKQAASDWEWRRIFA